MPQPAHADRSLSSRRQPSAAATGRSPDPTLPKDHDESVPPAAICIATSREDPRPAPTNSAPLDETDYDGWPPEVQSLYAITSEELPLIFASREEWMRVAYQHILYLMRGSPGYTDIPEPKFGIHVGHRTRRLKWLGRAIFPSDEEGRLDPRRSVHIEISDRVIRPAQALDVVAHEVAHAVCFRADGQPDQHRGNFIHLCRTAGLMPDANRRWTHTLFSPEACSHAEYFLRNVLGRWNHEWVGPEMPSIRRNMYVRMVCPPCRKLSQKSPPAEKVPYIRMIPCSVPIHVLAASPEERMAMVREYITDALIPDKCGMCGEDLVLDPDSVANFIKAVSENADWLPPAELRRNQAT